VDTSVWYAAADSCDAGNARAEEILVDDHFAVYRFGPKRNRAFDVVRWGRPLRRAPEAPYPPK